MKPVTATTPEKKQAPADSQESQPRETQSQEATSESAPPQTTEGGTAPSQSTEGNTPQPTESGTASASASAAAPATTTATSAQEQSKSDSATGKEPKARSVAPPKSVGGGEDENVGNSIPELTQLLMSSLEENTKQESLDSELRNTLHTQLIEFLKQSTSIDPEYLVGTYEQHLPQLINAQNQRLRLKHGEDRKAMLKESGVVKRIISKIPDIAQGAFKNHVYNPDKRMGIDNVNDEAEYEEEGWEGEGQQNPPPKRPGSTIPPPEAKKAAQPESMASYRNPKQEVVPSEAQVHSHSGGIGDDLEDEQLKQVLAQSVLETRHDPTEAPNTGGLAASSSPITPAVSQPPIQTDSPPL